MASVVKDLNGFRLTILLFAVVSSMLSWVGFQGIYGAPHGSAKMPTAMSQIWPIATQLALGLLTIAILTWSHQHAELPQRALAWQTRHFRSCFGVLLVFVGLGLAIGVAALRAFPNSGDEYDYLFQAATFRAGRLWNPLPPVADVFTISHVAEQDGKWVSTYFPGWALILAGFTILHLPSFVAPPALALLLVLAFSRLIRAAAGPAAVLPGAMLLCCCPFFLLNGASYFSHVPTALFAVLFALCGMHFFRTGAPAWGLAAGAALGAVGLIRPFTVFSLLIPWLTMIILCGGRRRYLQVLVVFVGASPFLIGLLFYNRAITGSPWWPIGSWANSAVHLGLHPMGEDGSPVSLMSTVGTALGQIGGLAKWTSPILCILYFLALLWKCWRRRVAFFDFIFPILVVCYLFVPFWRGNAYGPRYYFDAYPFLVLTVVSAGAAWFSESQDVLIQTGITVAFATALLIAVGSYPSLIYQFHHIVNERMELSDLVADARLSNAIVIIGSPTGSAYPMWMYSGDLTRNGIDFSGDVLYANDIPSKMCTLARMFPGRSFYRYSRNPPGAAGRLNPISPCPTATRAK